MEHRVGHRVLIRIPLPPARIRVQEPSHPRLIVPGPQVDQPIATDLLAGEAEARVAGPGADIGVAVGVEGLVEQDAAGAIGELTDRTQAVGAEVLGGAAVGLGHQTQTVEGEGDVGAGGLGGGMGRSMPPGSLPIPQHGAS